MIRKLPAILGLLLLLTCSSPVGAQKLWSWEPKTLEMHGPETSYEWAVPKLLATPGDTAHWQKLLDRHAAERLNEFSNAYDQARRENLELIRENPDFRPNPWESSGGYEVVWVDATQMILLWQGYDYRGGAHGLPVLEVTVMSTEQPDSLLPPSSLFTDEPRVLEALSAASRQGLLEQMSTMEPDEEWIMRGTAPSWENFAVVYPSFVDGPPRFEVVFPSYQVAPYAAGTPTVEIPWGVLSEWAPTLKDGARLP